MAEVFDVMETKGYIMSEIEVKHLSKTFEQNGVRVDALKDINLTIQAGDIYGIIGMSGAGKSTLVRCLNYLERPTDGQVLVEGKDLGSLSEKELRKQRSDIAMIFQHFNLLMQKNVIDNICFPLLIQGVSKKEAREKARERSDILRLQSVFSCVAVLQFTHGVAKGLFRPHEQCVVESGKA